MDFLPVEYSGQKSAWMRSEIFHAYFHSHSFTDVPRFTTHSSLRCAELSSLGLEPNVALVLDKCLPIPMKRTSLVMMEPSPHFTCHQMSLL